MRSETRNYTLPIGANLTPDGVRFRVWAPHAERVEVVIFDGNQEHARHAMQREDQSGPPSPNHGYWSATIAGLHAGTRYAYSVDGGDARPDPASRSQPDGVHAPSEVIDPAFDWTDDDWRGVPLADQIIYELHVGTATPDGTFDALIPKLPYFRDVGVTALEIMPIHDFPGCRNWGYDGVDLYAPARCYGGAAGFKRLVNAAHAHGLAIILDAVYNHFGPDGNYLRVFSPDYFTEQHHTPWGAALNLDQQNSGPVRDFLINNALYWTHEYHIDGFRLDATHALIDDSEPHLLKQLVAAVHDSLPPDRHFTIVAEDERADYRMALPQADGGWGLDGLWADDFHHESRVSQTGEQGGYYADYTGTLDELATTIRDGWLYQGQMSPSMNHPRGTSPLALHYPQFIYCIQNHDQVGNRPVGDRLNHTIDPAAYRALSALLLLVPETPLLWMGQEWAASTPFQFFTDHNAELGKLVTEGRRREFEYFAVASHIEVPDPQAESTFLNSKLRWDEIEQEPHARTLALYRDLLWLRRTHPALHRRDRDGTHVAVEHGSDQAGVLWLTRHGTAPADVLLIAVNLGATATAQIAGIDQAVHLRPLLDTNDPRYGGTAAAPIDQIDGTLQVRMDAPGVVVLGHV